MVSSLLLAKNGRFDGGYFLCIALCSYFLITLTFTLDPYLTRVNLLSWVGFAGMLLFVRHSSSGKHVFQRLNQGLLMVAALYCLWGLPSMGGGYLKSTFTNPDCFSILPIVAFYLALGQAIESKQTPRMIFLGAACFFLICVFLTGSRAALLGLLTGTLACLFLLYVRIRDAREAMAIAASPLIFGALGLLAVAGATSRMNRIESLLQGKDNITVLSRIEVLQHSPKALLTRPLGSGLGTFHLAYQEVRPPLRFGEGYMNVAHNDWLQIALESGFVGISLWLGIWLLALYRTWKSEYRAPGPCAGIFGALTAIATFSCFNFIVPIPASLLWLSVLLGLALSTTPLPEHSRRPVSFVGAGLLGAASALGLLLSTRLLKQSAIERQGDQFSRKLNWSSAYESYLKANQNFPDSCVILQKAADMAAKNFVFTGQSVWLDRQGKCLEQAHLASPRDIVRSIAYVQYLEFKGQLETAKRVLDEIHQSASYHPSIERALCRNDVLSGKLEDALSRLEALKFGKSEVEALAQAELALLLTERDESKGLMILKRWENTEQSELASENFVALALKRKKYLLARRVLEDLIERYPEKINYQFQVAQLEGEQGNLVRQVQVLAKLKKGDFTESQAKSTRKAWQEWCRVKVALKQNNEVAWELQNLLVKEPQESWARPILSELYNKKGLKSEARAVLRDGVNYDHDGSLRLMLADLCMKHGHPEIARGYYEELLAIPGISSSTIEGRLRQAKSQSKDVEDALQKLDQ